jgi:hypothetical protein
VERIADAFVWPVRDPEWAVKLLLVALISLIPIVGQINNIGWMLATLDRLRAGEERLAPANLNYIVRGARVFVVELIYACAIVIIGFAFYIPGLALALHQNNGNGNGGLIVLALLLNLITFGFVTLGSLGLTFALPTLILTVDREGIGAGLRVDKIVRRCLANPTDTLVAGLMLIASGFVAGLGVIGCGIGIFFTAAYAVAMNVWIIRSFEVGSTARVAG